YGIVGIGKQGWGYAKKLYAGKDGNAILAAVCDIDKGRRDKASAELSGVKVFEDYKDMLDKNIVDAVIIDTPHYLHPVIGIEALEKGLHVLSDKPIGVYTKAVRELNECAARHPDLKFGVLYNQRTNSAYRKAKEIVQSGQLGQLKRIVWIITDWYRPQAYYDQGGWRGTWGGEGGGVLINQDPHQLDLFTWIAGRKIESVWSVAGTVGRDINVENDVSAFCKFEGGATGVFITSTHESPGTNRLEITGDGGQIIITNKLGTKLVFKKNAVMEPKYSFDSIEERKRGVKKDWTQQKIAAKTYKYSQKLFELIGGQHIKVIRNFSEVVLGKKDKLIAPGEEGIIGLSLSNAIHLSGWTGEVVNFPIDEERYFSELQKKIELEKTQGIKR
ncbi:MAG: Gfo/Idh/MocA family oxidoreductase, partial [Clostridia bacterium]|nr:Gfo/Idh/MocA family oxidoreductase [Clostridia bacterium]